LILIFEDITAAADYDDVIAGGMESKRIANSFNK
jgi:hypothetical protein